MVALGWLNGTAWNCDCNWLIQHCFSEHGREMDRLYLVPKWYCFGIALFLSGQTAQAPLHMQQKRMKELQILPGMTTSRELPALTSAEDSLWCLWVFLSRVRNWERLEDPCECIITWPPLGWVWSLRMAQRTGRETVIGRFLFFCVERC